LAGSVATWTLERGDDLVCASCPALRSVDGLRHAFSTRQTTAPGEDPDGFDLGGRTPTAAIEQRRRRLLAAAGLANRRPIPLHQVHGGRVVCVDPRSPTGGEGPFEADGAILIGGSPSPWVPAVRTADCVPVLIADRGGRAVAALHAGWRGVVAGVVPCALEELERRGVGRQDLVAALGPAVGPCCYVVGAEVRAAFENALGGAAGPAFRSMDGDRYSLDLRFALRTQLGLQGIEGGAVSVAPWCTACRGDLFFSHRRDRERAGRMMAVIGWAQAT